jgi:cytochrome c oxidase subunit 2
MWPAIAVLLGVELGLLFILIKFRRKKGDPGLPKQVHGNNRMEIAWTIAPIVVLAMFVPAVVGGVIELGRTPKNAVEVDVSGIQWAWQFSYPDPSGGPPVEAPINEMHIPAGKDIEIKLHSDNVIHSFWVPKLAGKTDVMPGRLNHMWLRSNDIGDYSGQCAEFCGLDHAKMRFRVIVESPADFDAWLKAQAAAQHGGDPTQFALHGE